MLPVVSKASVCQAKWMSWTCAAARQAEARRCANLVQGMQQPHRHRYLPLAAVGLLGIHAKFSMLRRDSKPCIADALAHFIKLIQRKFFITYCTVLLRQCLFILKTKTVYKS